MTPSPRLHDYLNLIKDANALNYQHIHVNLKGERVLELIKDQGNFEPKINLSVKFLFYAYIRKIYKSQNTYQKPYYSQSTLVTVNIRI